MFQFQNENIYLKIFKESKKELMKSKKIYLKYKRKN